MGFAITTRIERNDEFGLVTQVVGSNSLLQFVWPHTAAFCLARQHLTCCSHTTNYLRAIWQGDADKIVAFHLLHGDASFQTGAVCPVLAAVKTHPSS